MQSVQKHCFSLSKMQIYGLFYCRRRRGYLSSLFEVLTTTGAHSSKFFILCLYMKTIRAKQAKVHFAYFVQRDQHGIIATDLN